MGYWDIQNCKHCGQHRGKLLDRWSRATYCSDSCKQAAYRRRCDPDVGTWERQKQRGQNTAHTKRKMVIRFNCEKCGTLVVRDGNQALQKYCTPACKQQAYRDRNKEKGMNDGHEQR